ncbi:hypothetical protein KVP08_023105 (plasmid) [Shewanella putrefaciens]|nr:hypothetical protein KVP08_023105 [Shewanella putrefaciens]
MAATDRQKCHLFCQKPAKQAPILSAAVPGVSLKQIKSIGCGLFFLPLAIRLGFRQISIV